MDLVVFEDKNGERWIADYDVLEESSFWRASCYDDFIHIGEDLWCVAKEEENEILSVFNSLKKSDFRQFREGMWSASKGKYFFENTIPPAYEGLCLWQVYDDNEEDE